MLCAQLGSEFKPILKLLSGNRSFTLRGLLQASTEKTSHVVDQLTCLLKHNVVRFDSTTELYALDADECLLRLSAPKWLSQIRDRLGETAYLILKETFVCGSMTRAEIAQLMQIKHHAGAADVETQVTELTL